jgi:adenylosuccinate lyase
MISRYTTDAMNRIWSEQARTETWLRVELAICEAAEKHGKIPAGTTEAIRAKAKFDLERMAELEKETRHDLMAFVRNVSENVGDPGRYFHYGVTSYDVIDTSLALMMRESLEHVISSLQALRKTVRKLMLKHKETPMIGRTHGIHAEPITFGYKAASWLTELRRSSKRLRQCRKEISVGKVSGPVGVRGVLGPEVEEEACRILGLRPDPVSTQIVSRDRHATVLNGLAVLGATLERIATELRNLQRTEILEVQEEFAAGQTGSSAMPHKRNPWHSETVCGLARVLRSNAMAMMESVSTWHERDLTNSSVERIILPDSFHLVDFMLNRVRTILERLEVREENMRRNLTLMGDLVYSEHLMIALIGKGLSREAAYKIAQRNAARAWEGEDFRKCVEADPEVQAHLSPEELEEVFSLEHHLRHVGPAIERVAQNRTLC